VAVSVRAGEPHPVEIHDKLGMVLIVLSLHHVAHRWGWLKKRTAELLGG
jgi:hypothetical protein